MSGLSEHEIRYRIEQAFSISGRMTIGMLQSFLTSRIPNSARDMVVSKMLSEGKLQQESVVMRSMRGHSSVVRVLSLTTNKKA